MENPTEYNDEYFEWEERPDNLPLAKHMICGSLAGIAEHVVFLPLDTLKTHRQSLMEKLSMWETAKYIKRSGGYTKFYRGSSIMAFGCIPAHSLYFGIYEYSQRLLNLHNNSSFNFFGHALTGILSTAFHDLILNPCEGEFFGFIFQ
jgi:solute carrier family 25 iron transporter 28/37